MAARPMTGAIAAASARHPWRTLGLWVLIVVAAVTLAAGVGPVFNDESDFTNNPESKRAAALLSQHADDQPITETIVVQAESHTVDDPRVRAAVEQTTADLRQMGIVAEVTNYYERTRAGDPAAAELVSTDRRATLIPVVLIGSDDDLAPHGAAFVATAQGHAGDGIAFYAVGDLSGSEAYSAIADEDLAKAERVGLPVALLVLIVVFGALVAPALPILLGIVSIVVAVGLTAIVSRFSPMTEEVTIMITMIGLAVGIDYALFMIARYREERRQGRPKQTAIEVAAATAGKAVVFSGATVVLALMGMFLVPITVFHSLAAGAILAVVVAVLATQTFVPALLGLLGDRIDWPRRRRGQRAEGRGQSITQSSVLSPQSSSGFWAWTTRTTMRHPVAALAISLTVLIGAALPALGLKTGEPGIETLPPTDVKTGFTILRDQFYAGVISPVTIVIDGADAAWVEAGVARLTAALTDDPLYGPPAIEQSPDGALTVVLIPLGVDPSSPRAYDAVAALRSDTIPAAFGVDAGRVHVGGASAEHLDFNTMLERYTPRVFAFVLGLTFLLLMLAFRSLVVPLKAVLMNLLSVGAAYGVLVAVFQHGIGADLLGIQRAETVVAWLPIFLFCVLFGLSMDYHVFLLSRIREQIDLGRDNETAVAIGLQATGKIITGAALIMVAVFGAFASGRIVGIQQMGLGLAVAVFLDATLVRTILVPATMKLLGDANWYLPRWLRWLPDLRIDAAPAAAPAD